MQRTVFFSKIHRATVTHSDQHYEGSVTVDSRLLEAAQIHCYECVHVWNVTRGTRLVTYALPGERDSGVICLNGAAAHLNAPGDLVILATFVTIDDAALRTHSPIVVHVDAHNRMTTRRDEIAGPAVHY